jgi:hypothetical protein
VVETGGLENRWARKGPGGSNPPLSARQSGLLFFSVIDFKCELTLVESQTTRFKAVERSGEGGRIG